MPEELWMEVHDILHEAVIKTNPKKKTCRKAKWLSEEDLQIAEKREAEGKGEKDRDDHLSVEFQEEQGERKPSSKSELKETHVPQS